MNDVSLVGRDTFLSFPHSRLAELAVDTNKRITLIHKYLISRLYSDHKHLNEHSVCCADKVEQGFDIIEVLGWCT